METRLRELEERIAFLQRHIEQQDRVILELSREAARGQERLARLEARVKQGLDEGTSGPPADEKPPHW